MAVNIYILGKERSDIRDKDAYKNEKGKIGQKEENGKDKTNENGKDRKIHENGKDKTSENGKGKKINENGKDKTNENGKDHKKEKIENK